MDPNEMAYINLYNAINSNNAYPMKDMALLKLQESFLLLFGYTMQTEPDPS